MDAIELRVVKLEETVAHLVQVIDSLTNNKTSKSEKTTKSEKPEKSQKTKKKATKSDDDEPKKKRAPSGYLLYINSIRQQVKQELGDEFGPKDITRELAKKWKELTDEEREQWNDKSKAIKESQEIE
jgi:hypothetical protein